MLLLLAPMPFLSQHRSPPLWAVWLSLGWFAVWFGGYLHFIHRSLKNQHRVCGLLCPGCGKQLDNYLIWFVLKAHRCRCGHHLVIGYPLAPDSAWADFQRESNRTGWIALSGFGIVCCGAGLMAPDLQLILRHWMGEPGLELTAAHWWRFGAILLLLVIGSGITIKTSAIANRWNERTRKKRRLSIQAASTTGGMAGSSPEAGR